MPELVLYAETMYISPYVFSSHVALREKGVAFDVVDVPLIRGAHLQPDYASASVTGRVPSLQHGDFRLAESSAIAEYLEELFPPPKYTRLLPESIRDRARARQVMAWLRSDLGALRDERSTITMFYRFRLNGLSPHARKDTDRLVRVAEQLIPTGQGPLFGEWTLVDAELAFMLHRLILNGEPLPERIVAYASTQWTRPSVREFVEHPRPRTVPDLYWAFSGTPRPQLA
ncbi:MAG TPA: glutathione transferase [Polyangiaceae bacterium]|nr:glutathione transferase [Polyangiaceae bacterium]